MNRRGFTLVEVMIASTLFVVLMGILAQLYIRMNGTTNLLNRKVTARDDARRAIEVISDELRQASAASLAGLPGEKLTYRVAVDADGNGSAVDAAGNLELSAARTLTRDYEDANHDGLRENQLIVVSEKGPVRVLANSLSPNEDQNKNGALDAGEDSNWNRRLERGIWFELTSGGVVATVETRAGGKLPPQGTARMTAFVLPRNP